MKLTIAKSAGYCFGVKRAVNMVYQEAEEAKVPVYTYGPIIHNEEVVSFYFSQPQRAKVENYYQTEHSWHALTYP